LRYVGQGHELRVNLPNRALTPGDATMIRADFETAYETIYGLSISDMDIQSVSWSVTVATKTQAPEPVRQTGDADAPEIMGQRKLYDAAIGEILPSALYWRPDLPPGATIMGPAVIAEDETSTVVPANFSATINSLGYIVLTDEGADHAG